MKRTVIISALAAIALIVASQVGARTNAGPTNLVDPSIEGAAIVGTTLTADKGTWSGAVNTYKYQWLRCKPEGGDDSSSATCATISDATQQTHVVVSSDTGKRLRVRVTATSGGGNTVATSAATSVVSTVDGIPASSGPPTISGSALVGSTLTGTTGTWVGDTPITYSYSWLKCDRDGNACSAISGATKSQYIIAKGLAGKTVRLRVIAKNARGKQDAFSTATDVVEDTGGGGGGGGGGGQTGIINLPNGEKSVEAKDVPREQRLVVDQVQFKPNPVTSRNSTITVRIKVKDTRGYVVRNATVFIRSTPKVTSGGDHAPTATDGWVSYSIVPTDAVPHQDRIQRPVLREGLPGERSDARRDLRQPAGAGGHQELVVGHRPACPMGQAGRGHWSVSALAEPDVARGTSRRRRRCRDRPGRSLRPRFPASAREAARDRAELRQGTCRD